MSSNKPKIILQLKKNKTNELIACGGGSYEPYSRCDVDGYPDGPVTYHYRTSFQIIGSDGKTIKDSFLNINDFAEALVKKLNL